MNLNRLELSAVLNLADGLGLSLGRRALLLEGADDIHALGDLAKDDVLSVEPSGDDSGHEKLRAVGSGASVGHGQQTGAVVLQLEVLIGKLLSVDGLSSGTVTLEKQAMVRKQIRPQMNNSLLTLVKSPPWSIKSGMMR